MTGPKPLSNILEITPYKGGEKLETGWKLSSNENPLGCSPLVREALAKVGEHLELYPDGGAGKLRQAIGTKYNVNPDNIVCGAGSDEIFQLLGRPWSRVRPRPFRLAAELLQRTQFACPFVGRISDG